MNISGNELVFLFGKKQLEIEVLTGQVAELQEKIKELSSDKNTAKVGSVKKEVGI
jgi:hypothetical protein